MAGRDTESDAVPCGSTSGNMSPLIVSANELFETISVFNNGHSLFLLYVHFVYYVMFHAIWLDLCYQVSDLGHLFCFVCGIMPFVVLLL